jgi:hypothetical protein
VLTRRVKARGRETSSPGCQAYGRDAAAITQFYAATPVFAGVAAHQPNTTAMTLEFRDDEHLAKWLLNAKAGLTVLRDVLPDLPETLVREVLSRNRTTYVLVRAYGDGWIEVYGEKHVRAKVIGLPATETADQERLLDEWVPLNLSLPYQQIDYPSNRRACAYVPPYLGFGEFTNGLLERGVEMGCVKGCNEIGAVK